MSKSTLETSTAESSQSLPSTSPSCNFSEEEARLKSLLAEPHHAVDIMLEPNHGNIAGVAKNDSSDRYVRTPIAGGMEQRNSRSDSVRRFLAFAESRHVKELHVCNGEDDSAYAVGTAPQRRKSCPAIAGRQRWEDARSSDATIQHRSQAFTTVCKDMDIVAVGPETFELQSMLGKGAFGEVYQVMHKQTREIFAMKVLRKQQVHSKNLVRYAMAERNLLAYIRHPFIVNLHYAFQTTSSLVMVLHYCPGGDLATLLKREKTLPEDAAQLYTAEIFLAIEYLHQRKVVYRDMKPENIVLDHEKHAMLTDFGLSKEGVEGLRGTMSFCGSIAYLAPEVLKRAGHGTPVDIYGLGVILYELLAGHPPFYDHDRKQLFHNICNADLPLPSGASSLAGRFLHATMARNPANRLGALDTSELRSHAFLSSLDFGVVLRRGIQVPALRRKNASSCFSSMNLQHLRVRGSEQSRNLQNPFNGQCGFDLGITEWEFAPARPTPAIGRQEQNISADEPGRSGCRGGCLLSFLKGRSRAS